MCWENGAGQVPHFRLILAQKHLVSRGPLLSTEASAHGWKSLGLISLRSYSRSSLATVGRSYEAMS